ncbi:MAG: DUF2541 domain-containing protein [Hyphomicrobium sp.]|nr:DUF2541 domain-containing protein [Hyphomicrobium sp.]PPD09101.1 MAG: DUF2541 domain-containing protein [Hyphomicrobium sp.]
MLRRLFMAGLALMAAGAISVAHAQDLVGIGTETIDVSKNGSTTIDVSKAPGAFRGIRVKNKGSSTIDLQRVQIIYSDGSVHNEDRQIDMKKGERSREIAASSTDKFIDKVSLTWKATSGKGALQVLGLQTRDGRRMERPKGPATGDLSEKTDAGAPVAADKGTVVDGNDVMFGYQNVGFGIDRDVIKVGGEIGKFDRLRLRVLGNDVHINNLKVVYMDGSEQDLAVDADIRANTRTSWLEVQGSKFIREIQMSYRSKPNFKGQARIEVTGQYADGWLGPNGEGKKFNAGWVLLGAQTAGFTGFDKDTITVGKNEGGFVKLRVVAKDRAITLREIRVVFFTGPDEVFTMRERVDPGNPYGPLEFKAGRSAIKEIQAKYRSRFDLAKGLKNLFEGTPAVVEIWGQH